MRKKILYFITTIFLLISIVAILIAASYFKLNKETTRYFESNKNFKMCLLSFPYWYGIGDGQLLVWNLLKADMQFPHHNINQQELRLILENTDRFKALEQLFVLPTVDSSSFRKICELTNLKILIVPNLKCQKIPREIANLTKLRELDLSGKSLTHLPEEIQKLSNLQSLYLTDTLINDEHREQIQLWLPNCEIPFGD